MTEHTPTREEAIAALRSELEETTEEQLGAYMINRLWYIAEVVKDIVEGFDPAELPGNLVPYMEEVIGPLLALEVATQVQDARREIELPWGAQVAEEETDGDTGPDSEAE